MSNIIVKHEQYFAVSKSLAIEVTIGSKKEFKDEDAVYLYFYIQGAVKKVKPENITVELTDHKQIIEAYLTATDLGIITFTIEDGEEVVYKSPEIEVLADNDHRVYDYPYGSYT